MVVPERTSSSPWYPHPNTRSGRQRNLCQGGWPRSVAIKSNVGCPTSRGFREVGLFQSPARRLSGGWPSSLHHIKPWGAPILAVFEKWGNFPRPFRLSPVENSVKLRRCAAFEPRAENPERSRGTWSQNCGKLCQVPPTPQFPLNRSSSKEYKVPNHV